MPLTPAQVNLVKATVPILKQHGKAITTTMYNNMLRDNPKFKNLFSLRAQVTGEQPLALAKSVLAYAQHIDDLPKLQHAVERIAQKHTSLFIKPEHYPIVGKHLVGAFGEVLGPALTPEITEAWIAAYGQLADVFINREAALYSQTGDWKTWRDFKIIKKEAENETVTSYYIEPVDGKKLPSFLPGQYLSVQVPIPGGDGLVQSRQFSLSAAPQSGANHYRISVKLEDTIENAPIEDVVAGKVYGLISNLLYRNYNVGDVFEVSPPAGEFFVDPADASAIKKPLVLLSAGVGATPLISIQDAVLNSETASRPINWIHGAYSSGSACFTAEARETAAKHENVTAKIFLETIRDSDTVGKDYDFTGRINLDKLAEENLLQLGDSTAEYYICGPEEWMLLVRDWLDNKGVARERQHLELFKTGDL
ncbi:globin-like protein [Mariannaea sp. PMI_226]|nr:globin-like protein [Mariannaea sp. PMI_226]